jgi:hypothetical protein
VVAVSLPDASVRRVFDRFYDDIVGRYWPPGRLLVEDGYRSVSLSFPELPAPSFEMEAALDAAGLAGYAATWSATRRYREAHASDPIPALLAAIEGAWPSGAAALRVTWPVVLRVARKP